MNYWRSLKFDEKPDYNKLRKYLQDISDSMNYQHDYYYDWILKNSSMSKRMSKSNIPLPPKVKSEQDSNFNMVGEDEDKKLTLKDNADENKDNQMIITNTSLKLRNISADPPIIRRESYNNQLNFLTSNNSYNNTKYAINPINGFIQKEFNPISSRKENPTAILAATGIISNDQTKYTKFNSKMGESSLNFANDTTLRQTTTNAYVGIGIPPLKKNLTGDHFNNQPYTITRTDPYNIPVSRGKGDFNSYFRSSAQAMFGNQAIIMPKITTNQVRARY